MVPFIGNCQSLPRFVPVTEHNKEVIQINTDERTFYYYVPKQIAGRRYSLLFLLHGGGGTGDGMIYLTRISDYAEEQGFIAVFPEGIGNRWNDGRNVKTSLTDQRNTDDVYFLKSLALLFQARYPIDEKRIHIAGISNGGFMTQRVLCEANDIFVSGFSVAANTSLNLSKFCQVNHPVSIGFIFGKRDDVVPYDGGEVKIPYQEGGTTKRLAGGETISFQDSILFWKKQLQCEFETKKRLPKMNRFWGQEIRFESFINRVTNSKVHSYLIEEGGHIWPHGFYYVSEKNYGYFSDDLDATKHILKFFSETAREQPEVN